MKENIKQYLSVNATYFIAVFGLILVFLGVELYMGKENLFLYLNAFHNPSLDFIFSYLTHVGDGLFFLLITGILLFYKKGWAVIGFICYLTTSFVAQFSKKVVFSGSPRPLKYFEQIGVDIRTIEGLEIHSWNSLPSGHTITTFAIATFLVLLISSKKWQPLIIVAAFIISYSRIYLAQHFPMDVISGAVIGVVVTFFTIVFVQHYWQNKSWYNKPLF